MPDYRELLKKYMAYVNNREGTDFVCGEVEDGGLRYSGNLFMPEDVRTLVEVSKEANPQDWAIR